MPGLALIHVQLAQREDARAEIERLAEDDFAAIDDPSSANRTAVRGFVVLLGSVQTFGGETFRNLQATSSELEMPGCRGFSRDLSRAIPQKSGHSRDLHPLDRASFGWRTVS